MGVANYTAAVLASAPDAYWPLDEYNAVRDISGNNRPMTSLSIPAAQYGQAGPVNGFKGVRCPGSTGATRASFSTQLDNFTAEFWFNGEVFAADFQGMFANQDGGTAGWQFLMRSSRRVVALAQGVGFLATGNTILTASTWYHLVVTRRSTVWMYFVNGQVDLANAGTTSPVGTPATTFIHTASSLQGLYSHVAYYDRSLSNAEIATHYQAAFIADDLAVSPGLRILTTA